MKAPYVATLTTSPSYCAPTSASGGSIINITISLPAAIASSSVDPSVKIPSSSISTEHPVSSSIFLIFLPFGPMTSPILSLGSSIVSSLGALPERLSAGSAIVSSIMSSM